jgi:hypothetical protein
VKLQRKSALDWRDHVGGEIVVLSIMLLGTAVITAWRASRQAEDNLNARTWARLLPPQEPTPDGSGAD